MWVVIFVLVVALVIQSLRVNSYNENAKYFESRGLEFWKMYVDECEKNRWKGKLPGSKHEHGHDYD